MACDEGVRMQKPQQKKFVEGSGAKISYQGKAAEAGRTKTRRWTVEAAVAGGSDAGNNGAAWERLRQYRTPLDDRTGKTHQQRVIVTA